MNSTRYAESRQALREVQQRQQDIVKVEQTLAELAQLFQEVCRSLVCLGLYHLIFFLADGYACRATGRGY